MAEQVAIQKELFNPAFWLLRHHMDDPTIRYIYIFGGSSAAKTYSLCQQIILNCLTKGENTLVTRKISSDLLDSIYADVKGIINAPTSEGGLELGDYFLCQQNIIKCKENGAYIRFRGMDDSEKVKGITRFTYVIMEEFSQYDEEDNKQLRKRLRGMKNQKVIYIWNPIDELMWQKTNLIDYEDWVDVSMYPHIDTLTGVTNQYEGMPGSGIAESKINIGGNAIYLRTNYLDNWYITGHPDGKHGFYDPHVMDDMAWTKKNDFAYYYVYGLGHWGRADRGGEYYKNFDDKRHLIEASEIGINDQLPFHISIDENVNPYLSMSVYQASGKSSWLIDEFAMKHPENTIFGMVKAFASRYSAWTKMPIFIYGDATSQKEDTKLEKGENFFKILAAELESYGFRTTLRVPRQNPGQILRGAFINQFLSKRGYEDIDFQISNDAVETIKDFLYLKEAADGKKFKEKVRHKVTKIPYEKYGHLSDSVDYFVCRYYQKEFDEFCRGKRSRPAKIIERIPISKRSNHY